jgi:hypothetical protein
MTPVVRLTLQIHAVHGMIHSLGCVLGPRVHLQICRVVSEIRLRRDLARRDLGAPPMRSAERPLLTSWNRARLRAATSRKEDWKRTSMPRVTPSRLGATSNSGTQSPLSWNQ